MWLLMALQGCATYPIGGSGSIHDACIGSFVDPVGSAPDPHEDLAHELSGTYRFENDLWPQLTLNVRPEDLDLSFGQQLEGCEYPNLLTAGGEATASWTPEQGDGSAGVAFFSASVTSAVAGTDPTPFANWIDESARVWNLEFGALRYFEVTLIWPDQTAIVNGYFNPIGQTGGTPEQIGPSLIPECETTFTKIE